MVPLPALPTNVLTYSYADVTSYAVRANLPADVVRILPWEKVSNGATRGMPADFWQKIGAAASTLVNSLVYVGQLIYQGLVALVTFLVNLGQAIWGRERDGKVLIPLADAHQPEGSRMVRSAGVSVLAVASFAFGVLAIIAALLMIPAFGVDYYEATTKVVLYTVIGLLGLIGGILYFASGMGVWRAAKWGWTLGVAASVLVLASSIWALITVFDVTIPLVQLVTALLVLVLLIGVRSAFRAPALGGTGGGPSG